MKFKQYIIEDIQQLDEKLITFGRKAYPKFNNVVILAGGAGSGKGFVLSKLIGLEGKTLDVDALKKLAIDSTKFSAVVKKETGKDLKRFDLKNPKNVSELHLLLGDHYRIADRNQNQLFKSIMLAHPDRKPNLIFDVTLKSYSKLTKLSMNLDNLGYEKTNIHLVWVINDVNVAKAQNKKRSRVVPEDILLDTHIGASITMKRIFDSGSSIKQYLDGDIWFAFNKAKVDTEIVKSKAGGSYIKNAETVKIKEQGKAPTSQLEKKVIDKILQYTPETPNWKKKDSKKKR